MILKVIGIVAFICLLAWEPFVSWMEREDEEA